MYWCVPKSPAHATCLILNRLWRSSWGWLVILLGSRATILVSLTLWLISPKSWHIKAYTAYSNAKMLQIMLRQFSVGGHCCILLSSLPFHSSLLQLLVLYISRKLSANEMKYSSVDKECLAIKWVAFILWYYLLEHLFTLCSGHILLRWLHGIPTHKLPTVACLKMTDFLSQWPPRRESYTSVGASWECTSEETSYGVIRIAHGDEIWGRSIALKNTVLSFIKRKRDSSPGQNE